jgi:hypothetical protein
MPPAVVLSDGGQSDTQPTAPMSLIQEGNYETTSCTYDISSLIRWAMYYVVFIQRDDVARHRIL